MASTKLWRRADGSHYNAEEALDPADVEVEVVQKTGAGIETRPVKSTNGEKKK